MLLVFVMKCCIKKPCSLPHNHYIAARFLHPHACLTCSSVHPCPNSSPIACPPSSVLCWCLLCFFLFLIFFIVFFWLFFLLFSFSLFFCVSCIFVLCIFSCGTCYFVPFLDSFMGFKKWTLNCYGAFLIQLWLVRQIFRLAFLDFWNKAKHLIKSQFRLGFWFLKKSQTR